MAKYTVLGKALDDIARDRDVYGPQEIEAHIKKKVGTSPTRSAWQQILTGETKNPRESTIRLFLEAFDATPEECAEVALKHLFQGRLGATPKIAA